MYSDFVFLDQFLFELSCKNTHTRKHGRTHTHTDSNEYPIVAFSKNERGRLRFQIHLEGPKGPSYQIWCFYPVCNDTLPPVTSVRS